MLRGKSDSRPDSYRNSNHSWWYIEVNAQIQPEPSAHISILLVSIITVRPNLGLVETEKNTECYILDSEEERNNILRH